MILPGLNGPRVVFGGTLNGLRVGKDVEFNFGFNDDGSIADDLPPCCAAIICPACGVIKGYCDDVPNQSEVKWLSDQQRKDIKNIMALPVPGAKPEAGQRQRKDRGGFPYLKSEHLSFDQRSAKILSVKLNEQGRFGAEVVCKIAFNGQTYLWSLRADNPNYTIAFDAWGPDENAWVGQEFKLALENDEFSGKNFPRLFLNSDTKPPKKK